MTSTRAKTCHEALNLSNLCRWSPQKHFEVLSVASGVQNHLSLNSTSTLPHVVFHSYFFLSIFTLTFTIPVSWLFKHA